MKFPILTLALATAGFVSHAQDWSQWGGTTGRNMFSPAKNLPDRFDPGKFKQGTEDVDMATTKNVKWVARLGSQSYGNTTVSQGKIFIGTNNDYPRDKQHQGDRSVLMCLDEKTGELAWQLIVPKLKSGKVNDWENLGILSSPKIEGNRVYLVTSRCEVICLDLNGLSDGNQGMQEEGAYIVKDTGKPPATPGPKDADIIWVYDMMDELGVFPHNASNSSPLILGDLVYVCTSNGQDWTHVNIPSPLSPSYIALNKTTGELAGEDDAGIGPKIYHGQWSSPSAGQVNGKWQVYAGGGDGVLYALDAEPKKAEDSSFLRKLWWFDANPPEYKVKDGKPIKYPAADGPSEINSTPVFYKNRVYVAIGQDPEHGEGIGRLVCVDATKTGDATANALIWEYRGIHRSISTVSIDPATGLLFVGDFSGFVHCLDAETGKLHWTYDMKAHMWGSTLVADGKVYVGDEDGDLVVLAATKEKKVLSETNLNAPVYSTPVVANGVLYIASNTHLFAFHDAARAAGLPDQPVKPDVKLDPAK
ncbi:MAG: PQQ-binding-like beta-propeller repeat protein [Verrucomicrobiales bacterium]|nr:PQQ-binding-like beta-propeller repeat protein [Verrucomicrobiales bacterium]